MSSEKILIVEDEKAISDMISTNLQMAGYQCYQAADANSAQRAAVNLKPDLILLDWMLLGERSGIDLCRLFKKDDLLSEIPIIMLTAKSDEENMITGLDAGADDYITKPFSVRELKSRIKAVLRRTSLLSAQKPLTALSLSLDPVSQRVSSDGHLIEIGPTEYRLLAFLMSHPERAYTRSQILDHVWGGNIYIEDRTIDVHIRRLRKVLEPHDCDKMIQTVRGTGYRFSTQVDASGG